MRALTNDDLGFESCCFVCEPRNAAGLGIPFFHDEAAGVVSATFDLDDRFSGAPAYVHGGVLLAILDEAMAWATIALAGRWAVTGETTTRFERPVHVGLRHTVTATVVDTVRGGRSGSTLRTTGEIVDAAGRVCARAEATFVPLGETQTIEATRTGSAVDPAGIT